MKTSLMMAMALFPDAVSYQYVPGPRVLIAGVENRNILAALRSGDGERLAEAASMESEKIDLEIITESPPWVMAGMSNRYKKVFIYEENDYREYE